VFPKLEAHHVNYKHLYGELMDGLLTLCRGYDPAELRQSLQ